MPLKLSTITQSVTIAAAPDKVYDALMDSKNHAAITGSPARMSARVGGKFTAWDGYIFGKNLELVRGRKIVQEWSTTEWPRGYPPSKLEITLTGTKRGTQLKMVHSKVPTGQKGDYAQGWKEYYWAQLRTHFEGRD